MSNHHQPTTPHHRHHSAGVSTVDTMLEWMRERNRATRRFQEVCHEQYAQRSPVVLLSSPRQHSESAQPVISSRGESSSSGARKTEGLQPHERQRVPAIHMQAATAARSSPRASSTSPRVTSSSVVHLEVASTATRRVSPSVEVVEALEVDIAESRRHTTEYVDVTTLPSSSSAGHVARDNLRSGGSLGRLYNSTASKSPRGDGTPRGGSIAVPSPHRRAASGGATMSRILQELENEDLWLKIHELREALNERDTLLAASNDMCVLLKRKERALAASMVQSSLRHAEAMVGLTQHQRQLKERESYVGTGVSNSECDDDDVGDRSTVPMTRSQQRSGGAGICWWKAPLFTNDEQRTLDEIRLRSRAVEAAV